MLIRAHVKSPNGRWCLFCGARVDEYGNFGSKATCTPREDGIDQRALRPEPKRREIACEDAETISERILKIRAESQPRCPRTADRLLYDCLRSSQKCGDDCPHKSDWIGPEK